MGASSRSFRLSGVDLVSSPSNVWHGTSRSKICTSSALPVRCGTFVKRVDMPRPTPEPTSKDTKPCSCINRIHRIELPGQKIGIAYAQTRGICSKTHGSTPTLLKQNTGAILTVAQKNRSAPSKPVDGAGCAQEMVGLCSQGTEPLLAQF